MTPQSDRRLRPCPATPNCVSSLAEDTAHRVEPLPLAGDPQAALARLERVIGEMPGGEVREREAGYLRARFVSRLFGFVDDVELAVDAAAGVVHVRSASRSGRWDLGVNRRRVEALRARYTAG